MDIQRGIEIRGLGKSYGELQALSELTLTIEPGQIVGLLGRNGAGKTTTLRLLMGMLEASAGTARIHGLDCFNDRVELKRHVGYLPDVPVFYDYLTAWELVRFVGAMHGLPAKTLSDRAERLFRELELEDVVDDFAVNFSLGTKRKFALMLALLHEPSVLILDEATTGLDPLAARDIRELIASAAAKGRAVLISTHLLEMAEKLCDQVAVLDRGRLVAQGSPAELCDRFLEQRAARASSLEDAFVAAIEAERAPRRGLAVG